MLFSGAIFSGTALSASGGAAVSDPRILVAIDMLASGGATFSVDAEFAAVMDCAVTGTLDAPLVRIRRTTAALPGIGSFAADVSVSPVMVTLDGIGGMAVAVWYAQARVRALMSAGGGADVAMGAGRSLRSVMGAGGGMAAQVFEYHKAAAAFEAEGGAIIFGGRWTALDALFQAEGGMEVDTAYDLFGPVVTVLANDAVHIVVLAQAVADGTVVLAAEHGDIIVVAEGF